MRTLRSIGVGVLFFLFSTIALSGETYYFSDQFGTQFEVIPVLPFFGYILGVETEDGQRIETLYLDGKLHKKTVTTFTQENTIVEYYEEQTLVKTHYLDLNGFLLQIIDYNEDESTRVVKYERFEGGEMILSHFQDDDLLYRDTFLRDTSGVIQRRIRTYPDGREENMFIITSNEALGDTYTVEGYDLDFRIYESGEDGFLDYQWFKNGFYVGGRHSEYSEGDLHVIRTTASDGTQKQEFFTGLGVLKEMRMYDTEGILIHVEEYSYIESEHLNEVKVQTTKASYIKRYTYDSNFTILSEKIYRSGKIEMEIDYFPDNRRQERIYLDSLVLTLVYQGETLIDRQTEFR